MASHGNVLDLFDDRYLQLQDVEGNVEPFPIPVRQEVYYHPITVYGIGIPLDIFTGLIQDFTDRYAMETGEEQWSWLVQWKVQKPEDGDRNLAFKRPRLWTDRLSVPPTPSVSTQSPRVQRDEKRFYKPLGRRRFDPELAKIDEILKVLLDIFQADASKVPSLIEILYEYLDYYEGDGYALKCAMQKEIPNLWAFERPPVRLPHEPLKAQEEIIRDHDSEEDDVEFSQRRQYGEKRFGLRAPKVDFPISPLINMPPAGDHAARTRYHAACFKSRELALGLLKEAGMSEMQIANYKLGQQEHPMDTPEDGIGEGFKNYKVDKRLYHELRELRDQVTRFDKSVEALTNVRLDFQAQQAAHRAELEAMDLTSTREGSSSTLAVPAPLIPHTPSSAFRRDTDQDIEIDRVASESLVDVDPISEVPYVVAPFLKSRLFSAALSQIDLPTEDSHDPDSISEDDEEPNEEDTGVDGGTDAMDVTPNASVTPTNLSANPLVAVWNDGIRNALRQYTPAEVAHMLPALLQRFRARVALHRAAQAAAQAQAAASANPSSGPSSAGPSSAGPSSAGPSSAGPSSAGPSSAGPSSAGPSSAGPSSAGPSSAGPSSAGPSSAGPSAGPSHSRGPSMMSTQTASGAAVAPIVPLPAPTSAMLQISALMQPASANSGPQAQQALQLPVAAPAPNHTLLTPGLQNLSVNGSPSGIASTPTTSNHSLLTPGLHGLSVNTAAANSLSPNILITPSSSTAASVSDQQLPPPPSPTVAFPPPRPSIQRDNVPSPINTSSTTTTTTNPPSEGSGSTNVHTFLPPLHLGASDTSEPRTICMHFPHVLLPRNTLRGGEDGNEDDEAMDTDSPTDTSEERTDAIMLGYEDMNTGTIELTRAIFLPAHIGSILHRKMIHGNYRLIERYAGQYGVTWTYMAHNRTGKAKGPKPVDPHVQAHEKLMQALSFMYLHAGAADREQLLSKRWRVSPGMMTETDRGGVWEGWAVVLDAPIQMTAEERERAIKVRPLNLDARRLKEIEEMLEEY